jgi:DNA-binding NarL/FixJ family response regulator
VVVVAVRVVVVDDDAEFRASMQFMLEMQDDLEWAGEAASADEAIRVCGDAQPDAVIIDVRMPGGGPAAVQGIRASSPRTVVIALSGHAGLQARVGMMDAGADTYVMEGSSMLQMLDTLRAAVEERPPAPVEADQGPADAAAPGDAPRDELGG